MLLQPDVEWLSEAASVQMLCSFRSLPDDVGLPAPAAAAAGACRAARAPGGAAARSPPPEVLGNGSVEVPDGGAGGHGDHPGVPRGLVGGGAGGGVRRQQALDEVPRRVGHRGPRLWKQKSQFRHSGNNAVPL